MRKGQYPKERMSVDEDILEFCGWNFLARLINECENTPYQYSVEKHRRRDRALVVTAFLTGGRISEVLMLRKSNFEFQDERIIVKDMALLKRFKKTKEYLDMVEGKEQPTGPYGHLYHWSHKYEAWIKRRFDTKPVVKIREEFPIPYFEPLTTITVEWIKEAKDFLFPTNHLGGKFYSDGVEKFAREYLGVKSRKWITKVFAYSTIREIGDRALKGSKLKVKMKPEFHLWCHWFRSQRASQLGQEYGFKETHLKRFFGWKVFKRSMPSLYAKVSTEELWQLMKPDKIKYERK